MRALPEKGLIVSCYLDSMRYCERDFISAVAHVPGVVGLRVEGLENIEFARRIAPERFIIGLVKVKQGANKTAITPSLKDAYNVHYAGADMVATSHLHEWTHPLGDEICTPHGFAVPFRIMADMSGEMFRKLCERSELLLAPFRREIDERNLVFATTFEDYGIGLLQNIKKAFPGALVNLEGGVWNGKMVWRAYDFGANWVTIGKAINDPPFIIGKILGQQEATDHCLCSDDPGMGEYKPLNIG